MEHSEGGESLNHGFGSYVAAEIVECLKRCAASERKMTGHLPDALDTFRQNKQIIRKNELDDYGQGKIMVRTVNCNLCMNDTLHWHSEIELLHILTPSVKLYIEGEITPVDMGDSIAILPGALHDTFCPRVGVCL